MTNFPSIPAAPSGPFSGARVTMTSIPEAGAGTAGRRMKDGCWSVRFDTGDFGWWTPEVLSLLLDSPLALCHAARWLATRLGCDPGATAPGWEYVALDDYDMVATPAHYRLTGAGWARVFTEETGFNAEYFFGDPRPILRQTRSDAGVEAYEHHPYHPTTVPGILGMSPAEALAAACVTVGGAS